MTKNNITLNLILSTSSKAIGIFSSFLMIPLLLKSLGVEQYGIWVTVSSVAAWLMFFDFGLGNSFKNIVATSDKNRIQKEYYLVFSLYCYVALALLLSVILFLVINHKELNNSVTIIALYLPLLILFPLQLFSFGVQGFRLVGLNSILDTLRVLIWLGFAVLYLSYKNDNKLYILSLIFVAATVLPQTIQLYIFKKKCGFSLKPSFLSLRLIIKEESFKLGLRFFIIQLSSLVSFNLGNVLVYNYFGSSDVASYDVFNKVFLAGLSIFNMTIAVIWPEISKAYADRAIVKCKKLYHVLLLISLFFCAGVFIVALNFDLILKLLNVDGLIVIDANLLWSVALLTCLQSIAYCGAVVLNAINKLNLQIYLAVASIILIYPLFHLMVNMKIGLASYPFASGLLVLIGAVLYNLQSIRLLKVNCES
jgi:O-antigen/teichoic acid export membrane protein